MFSVFNMISLAKLLFVVLSVVLPSSCEVIEVEHGKIEGTVMETREGEEFHAFLKIPFAQPPLGDLRFQAPVEMTRWEGVRDGTTIGPMCTQVNLLSNSPTHEDCLFLNVFTKNLSNQEALKPVVAYIHGGAFQLGSASDHEPHLLMERDVVLVTINYRLGAFGFLSLGTKEISGNQGLKDQSMALKWIQRNIKTFGGNPKMVTLMGNSAGAYSVTAHLVSPMSTGLFLRAIALSGAITWQKKFEHDYVDLAKNLAEKLNCTTQNNDEMISCLRKTPSTAFNFVELREYPQCTIMTWFPVIERDFGQERFLTENPLTLFESGKFAKVPLIIGRTRDEFIDIPMRMMANEIQTQLVDDFDKVAPHCFFYEPSTEKSKARSEKLRSAYFQNTEIDMRSIKSLCELFSDGYIGYPIHRLINTISNLTDVFYYQLSYVGRHSYFKFPHGKPYGVHHSDEMQYIMTTAFVGPRIEKEDFENDKVELMTRIISQFAETGNPNSDTDEYLKEIFWPKHDLENEFYLDIGQHSVEKHGLNRDKYSVWDELEKSFTVTRVVNRCILFLSFVSITIL